MGEASGNRGEGGCEFVWVATAQFVADQHEGIEEGICDVGGVVEGRNPFVWSDFFEGRHGSGEPGIEFECVESIEGFFSPGGSKD